MRSTAANPPRRGSSKHSIRCRRSVRPAKPSSSASGTKVGHATRPLGKLGVAVSRARSGRVWALVETEAEKTRLYRSEDYGESWALISSHRDLMHRPCYYTHVFADPCHGRRSMSPICSSGNRPTPERPLRRSRRRTATITTSGSILPIPTGWQTSACICLVYIAADFKTTR